jgi:hypothetical protein
VEGRGATPARWTKAATVAWSQDKQQAVEKSRRAMMQAKKGVG